MDELSNKLNFEKFTFHIGGYTVSTRLSITFDDSIKSATTVIDGKAVSTADSKEQVKGKVEIEQWEVGEIEAEIRPKDQKRKGTLTGIRTSLTGTDERGRSFSCPQVLFVKGQVKLDGKAEDDKVSLDFEIESDYEIILHGGN